MGLELCGEVGAGERVQPRASAHRSMIHCMGIVQLCDQRW